MGVCVELFIVIFTVHIHIKTTTMKRITHIYYKCILWTRLKGLFSSVLLNNVMSSDMVQTFDCLIQRRVPRLLIKATIFPFINKLIQSHTGMQIGPVVVYVSDFRLRGLWFKSNTGLMWISQGTRNKSPRLHSNKVWIGTLRGLCLCMFDILGYSMLAAVK